MSVRVVNGKCFIKLKPEPAKMKKTIINTVCTEAGVYCHVMCSPHKDVIHLEIENKPDIVVTNVWTKIKEVMRLVLVLSFVDDIYNIKLTPLTLNSFQGNTIANVKDGIDLKDWYPKHSLSDDGLEKPLITSDFKSTNEELEKVFEGLFLKARTSTNENAPNTIKNKTLSNLSDGSTKSKPNSRSNSHLSNELTNRPKSQILIRSSSTDNPQTKEDDIEPEDSASNIQLSQKDVKLSSPKFRNGILKFGKFELDRTKPSEWSSEAIKALHQKGCPYCISLPTDPNEPLITGDQLKVICNYLLVKHDEGFCISDDSAFFAEQIIKISKCKGKDVAYIGEIVIWLCLNVLFLVRE